MSNVESTHEHQTETQEGLSPVLSFAGSFDPSQAQTTLHMENGETIQIETSVLNRALGETLDQPSGGLRPGAATSVVVPLVEERIDIGKRTVPTGTVRLHKSTRAFTQTLDEVLATRTFDIERVTLNRPVKNAPPVRQEGNVTIYSLVEEQLVLTKELVLREEVRIVQRDTEVRDTRVVTLHKDHLTIERENY